jgi:hypothetical protein
MLSACFSKPPPPSGDAGSAGSAGGIAFIQTNGSVTNNADISLVTSLMQEVHAGDLIVVAVDWNFSAGMQTASFTDTDTDMFTVATATTADGAVAELAYATAGSDGPDSVTITLDAPAANYIEQRVLDYGGLTALDVAHGGSGETETPGPITVGPITTAAAGELVVAFVDSDGGTAAAGSGMMLRSGFDGDAVEDAIAPAAGAYTATAAVDAASKWLMCVAAFR